MTNWIYHLDGYIELKAEQRSPEWFDGRKFRITSSVLESLITETSKFSTMKETIEKILGTAPPTVQNEDMLRGTIYEPYLRNAYIEMTNYKIYEPGLCIGTVTYDHPMISDGKLMSTKYSSMFKNPEHPNWYIGASPDGIIQTPIESKAMEIKCPRKIPNSLLLNAKKWNENNKNFKIIPRYYRMCPNEDLYKIFDAEILDYYGKYCRSGILDYYEHIYISHFLQMQQHMHILQKRECVYLVGTFEETYIENVKFDERYYKHVIYPKLVDIIERKIKPDMPLKEREEFNKRVCKIIKNLPVNFIEKIIPW